jgi:hypothetical protein
MVKPSAQIPTGPNRRATHEHPDYHRRSSVERIINLVKAWIPAAQVEIEARVIRRILCSPDDSALI